MVRSVCELSSDMMSSVTCALAMMIVMMTLLVYATTSVIAVSGSTSHV